METKYWETDAKEKRMLDPEIVRAEHMLAEAGIGFTEVARCPAASCEVCDMVRLDAAA